MIIDLNYIIWLISLKDRVPSVVSSAFGKASVGALDSLYKMLGEYLQKQKVKRNNNVERNMQELNEFQNRV